jgi:hypothetical protein
MLAGSVAAAPIGQSMALKNVDNSAVEQVQWRHRGHWRGGRWIGPAIGGFAAGVAIGALAAPRYYDDGYYAYGAAPGYYGDGYDAYNAAPTYVAPRYRGNSAYGASPDDPAPGSAAICPGTSSGQSAYPSWMCR